MARIKVNVDPTTDVEVQDIRLPEWGHLPSVTFDGVEVQIGWGPMTADRDAAIVAACGLLIEPLTAFRTAAMERIRAAEIAAIAEASGPGDREVVAEWTRVAS
jgi:hypothetical protein